MYIINTPTPHPLKYSVTFLFKGYLFLYFILFLVTGGYRVLSKGVGVVALIFGKEWEVGVGFFFFERLIKK